MTEKKSPQTISEHEQELNRLKYQVSYRLKQERLLHERVKELQSEVKRLLAGGNPDEKGGYLATELRRTEDEINSLKYQVAYRKRQEVALAKDLKNIKKKKLVRIALFLDRRFGQLRKVVRNSVPSFLSDDAAKRKRVSRLDKIHANLVSQARNISLSNGSSLYKKYNLNVAIITDEYMFNYYKDAFENVFWLTPSNYKNIFSENRIDIFLYVSCWRGGQQNEWRGHMQSPALMGNLEEILDLSRASGAKTIFQTIEDPSNFEHFLPLAKKFAHVFTSDADILENYRNQCPASVVGYAEYGVNPIFNNPIGTLENIKYDALFAGSYPRRYKERCDDMELVFDSLIGSGLDLLVADRNFGIGMKEYDFPLKYAERVIASLPHALLQSVHKLFAVNVNLNSIKGSDTMCAMRVYELQAQGTIIVSNYAKSIANRFGNINIVVGQRDLTLYKLDRMSVVNAYKRSRTVRKVMSGRTVFHQVEKLLGAIGQATDSLIRHRILLVTDAQGTQSGCRGVEDKADVYYVKLAEYSESSLDGYDFVAFFDENVEYEPHYLVDMLDAFAYVNVPFVTREKYIDSSGQFVAGRVHEYTQVAPERYRSLFRLNAEFRNVVSGYLKGGSEIGRGYSHDMFGMNLRTYNAKQHVANGGGGDPFLSIIVPVHNNGDLLLERCIESLLANSMFDKFEIILVDDCSDDIETHLILSDLQRLYPNVNVVYMTGGPSGSASAPRNRGLEVARAEYVTYLDPDNCISSQGYDNLLRQALGDRTLDCVFGYQVKVTSKAATPIGKLFPNSPAIVNNPRVDLIEKRKFPVVSTQASVIKKSVLINNSIDYIVGAVGQDTVFGYEVLLAAKKVAFVDNAFIEYYAERTGSVTNNVTVRYFERSYMLEVEQKRRLQKQGCWDLYAARRSKAFVEGWYVPKLRQVSADDFAKCEEIVKSIFALNGVEYNSARNMEL